MNVIASTVERVTEEYPTEELRQFFRRDIRRQTFQVALVTELAPGGALIDIGGGITAFTATCAQLGMKVTLVDDFDDPMNHLHGGDALTPHQQRGVTVVRRDVIADGLGLPRASADIVTCFHSMEHWHKSPKALFAEVVEVLKPGGWFLLCGPNCVNLRKRVTAPLGRYKWSQMADWYERPVFRGHVREPDVADLRYIVRDMGLDMVRIYGRNWLGYKSPRQWVRRVTSLVDRPLQQFPSLCSDLYALGRKPV